MKKDMIKLEQAIGYRFKNRLLLEEALTHSSYANERKQEQAKNNERLEFLGDAVLSVVVSDFLFKTHTQLPEGELTKLRAKVVCEQALSDCARKIDLGGYLILGRGEEMTGGRKRASILADAFEALIAAIYLDSGVDVARPFILSHIEPLIEQVASGKMIHDYKTHLQEIVQTKRDQHVAYELVRSEGPDHNKTFHMQVCLNDEIIGTGSGHSKKEAEQAAAKEAVSFLNKRWRG